MTASLDPARDRRLDQLRRRMVTMAGSEGAGGEAATPGAAVLPVPSALASLLPAGGLVRGSVVAYSGAEVLLAGLIAAVTEAGGHAVVIGRPRFGVLAAVEMGARLDRLALVPDPGGDPVEIASVLLDGLDLVVLGLGGRAVPPGRVRVLTARARSKGAVLLVTNGEWGAPTLRLTARVVDCAGLGEGSGRIRELRLEVTVAGRSVPLRRARLTLTSLDDRTSWVPVAENGGGPHADQRGGHRGSFREVVGY